MTCALAARASPRRRGAGELRGARHAGGRRAWGATPTGLPLFGPALHSTGVLRGEVPQAGALGAKMSGTGRGGLMLALTPDEATQRATAAALEAAGAAQVWTTTFA